MSLFSFSGSDEDEGEHQQTVVDSPSRRVPPPSFARLGKRSVSTSDDDNDEDGNQLKLVHRAVPTNFRFAGLGKRRVSLAYKAAGLGKRADDRGEWALYEAENRLRGGGRPEAEIRHGEEPVVDDFAEEKRAVSTAMRYAGIGKRQRSRVDAGMRYRGFGRP